MAQSNLLSKENSGKKLTGNPQRLKITVPHFDNTELIKGYSKTMIGRCLNPRIQDMKSLLFMLPRIWKMEERIAGADLGMGRFQLDFDNEEDILEVLRMEPYHFDYWMISLVRWEPVVDPNYPSRLKFWVRVMGVPLHFWAAPTFEKIGDGIGEAQEVDLDNGRVQVVIDGFKPLVFETLVEFYNGEETLVTLRYERLFGFCRICFSLCHDQDMCPSKERERGMVDHRDLSGTSSHVTRQDRAMISYKGAVTLGKNDDRVEGKNGLKWSYEEHNKGKGKLHDSSRLENSRREPWNNSMRCERRLGVGPSSFSSQPRNVSPNALRQRSVAVTTGLDQLNDPNIGQGLSDHERLMLQAFQGKGPSQYSTSQDSRNTENGEAAANGSESSKKVRKELLFNEESQEAKETFKMELEVTNNLASNLVLEEMSDDIGELVTHTDTKVGENVLSEEMDSSIAENLIVGSDVR